MIGKKKAFDTHGRNGDAFGALPSAVWVTAASV